MAAAWWSLAEQLCSFFLALVWSTIHVSNFRRSQTKDTHRVSMRMQFAIVRNALGFVQCHSQIINYQFEYQYTVRM